MQIGAKLKAARTQSGLTQEQVADRIQVSRQSVSNGENERNFPDIISVIRLSELYGISLDMLLKGDEAMMRHLDTSTNVVKSNRKLLIAIALNVLLIVALTLLIALDMQSKALIFIIFSLVFVSTGAVFYEIIKKI